MEITFIIIFAFIVFWASMVHGSIGFGFGMISTPLVALFTDMQTAITYMLIPTMITNIVSIISEGNLFEAFKKFYFILFLMIIGSGLGTVLLVHFNSEYFKLLLAVIIFVYLLQSAVKIEASFISKYPKASTYGLGIIGGIISGLTNVVAPLMIIYTLELKYSKKDTIQLSNLCFLFTKLSQLAVFLSLGAFSIRTLEVSMFGTFAVSLGLFFGLKIKKKIDRKFYTKILKTLLFLIASFLVLNTIYT